MGTGDLKLNLWLKERPRLMLCCSKADRGILIGRLLQVNRYLHIGPPISTAPRVASSFAGRGAASAASIDMILETARFELVVGSSASQDDHFSPLRHPKGINRRRLVEALAEGNDERQHSQGGRHHIQITTTQTASPPMTPPGAADNHI